MDSVSLTATKRASLGKLNNKLRKTGAIPAVLYGHNVETLNVQVNERDFAKVFKLAGESTLVNLTIDGQTKPVLIQEVQSHYLTDKPIHIDFYAVNMSEKLKAKIPLHFTGEAQAVKSLGGTLVRNLSEIEVECLPADLPHALEIDISALNTFEDAVHVSDIKVTNKVTILTNSDEVVANVVAPRTEEEMAELATAPVVEDVTKVEGVVKPEAPAAAESEEKKSKE